MVCSYISHKHEFILQACRDTKTISIFYDYSGFSCNINHPGYAAIDLIGNPNYYHIWISKMRTI